MGEFLGLGLTHYPLLSVADDRMADLLRWTLTDPGIPESEKDPAHWPAPDRRLPAVPGLRRRGHAFPVRVPADHGELLRPARDRRARWAGPVRRHPRRAPRPGRPEPETVLPAGRGGRPCDGEDRPPG